MIFFSLFWKSTIIFCLELNSVWKMLSFDVYYVDIDQKIQNLKILLVFSNFWVDFQIFAIFFNLWKKYSKKGSNQLGMIPAGRITWFLSFWWLQTWDSWPVPLRHRLRPIKNFRGVRLNRVKVEKTRGWNRGLEILEKV